MEFLRWALLLIGVAVLIAVFLLSRRRVESADTNGDLFDSPESSAPDWDSLDRDDRSAAANSVVITDSDARSHVLSNLSHELETLNQLLGRTGDAEMSGRTDPESARAPESVAQDDPDQAPLAAEPGEPVLGDLFDDVLHEDDGPTLESLAQPEKIVTLHVCARDGEMLQGGDLLALFEERGYEFGKMNIFHSRFDGNTVFSIVNTVEPGVFDLPAMNELATPGVSLFLQLPGPLAADVAFDVLVNEAREIAKSLNARVLDATRSTLTLQMEQHMREEMKRFSFNQKRNTDRTPIL